MKTTTKIKFILLVAMSMFLSFNAFASETETQTALEISMKQEVDLDTYSRLDEKTFEEDEGIDISNEELENVLNDVYDVI